MLNDNDINNMSMSRGLAPCYLMQASNQFQGCARPKVPAAGGGGIEEHLVRVIISREEERMADGDSVTVIHVNTAPCWAQRCPDLTSHLDGRGRPWQQVATGFQRRQEEEKREIGDTGDHLAELGCDMWRPLHHRHLRTRADTRTTLGHTDTSRSFLSSVTRRTAAVWCNTHAAPCSMGVKWQHQ